MHVASGRAWETEIRKKAEEQTPGTFSWVFLMVLSIQFFAILKKIWFKDYFV